jgi:hypothetical protein
MNMFECVICEKEVNDKGFRLFLEIPQFSLYGDKRQKFIIGKATHQIRICGNCLKQSGKNLKGKI